MAVNQSDLDALAHVEATTPEHMLEDLTALEKIPEVIAYLAASARASGESDEADLVELVVRYHGMKPDDVRTAERVLRKLVYVRVCERLKQIAGRKKVAPVPVGK